MLDQEFAIRWVRALRSGTYRQGTRYLRNVDDHYCCLGVAADLIDPKAWRKWLVWYQWGSSYGLLSVETETRIGLTAIGQRELACMNDNGRTFAEIADQIERMAGIAPAEVGR